MMEQIQEGGQRELKKERGKRNKKEGDEDQDPTMALPT